MLAVVTALGVSKHGRKEVYSLTTEYKNCNGQIGNWEESLVVCMALGAETPFLQPDPQE